MIEYSASNRTHTTNQPLSGFRIITEEQVEAGVVEDYKETSASGYSRLVTNMNLQVWNYCCFNSGYQTCANASRTKFSEERGAGHKQLLAFRTGKESFLQEGSHGKLTTVQWKNTYPRLPGEQICLEGFKVRRHKNGWVEEGKEWQKILKIQQQQQQKEMEKERP